MKFYLFFIVILDTNTLRLFQNSSTEENLKKKVTHVLTQGKILNVKFPLVESLRVTILRARLSEIGIPMVK